MMDLHSHFETLLIHKIFNGLQATTYLLLYVYSTSNYSNNSVFCVNIL